MGKGTKHASDWKMTTLKVAIDARRLYVHSVKIMGNEKVFKPSNDFRGATLMTIHENLLDVYVKVWEANRINVAKNPALAGERLALQRFALQSCDRLLALFELAKNQFHLNSGKFWNWMNMLVEVGKEISAWHKSDTERYGSEEDLGNQNGSRLKSLGLQREVAVR